MRDREVFELFCRYCHERFEHEALREALKRVEEHEIQVHATKHGLPVASAVAAGGKTYQ